MMGECNLTLIPFDDPTKKILEEVIEHGYDGSDVTKVKGKYICTNTILYQYLISFANISSGFARHTIID